MASYSLIHKNLLLIPPENIPRINLAHHIVQTTIISIGNDNVAHLLKLGEVVHHGTAEERAAILQRRLIDDHTGAFRLDTLHHALDRGLAEVVAVRFHRQAIDTDHAILFLRAPVIIPVVVTVIAGLAHT